jgi:hypothetical protein
MLLILVDRVSVWDMRTQPHYLHFQRALFARIRERVSQSPTDQWMVSVNTIQRVFGGEDPLSRIRAFHRTEVCVLVHSTSDALSLKVVADVPLNHDRNQTNEDEPYWANIRRGDAAFCCPV